MIILENHSKKNIFKLFLSLILFTSVSYSQTENTNDVGGWTAIGIEYELNKKWNIELEAQLRLKDNISVVDEYFTEFSVEYLISKKIIVGGGLRYIKENDTKGKIQGYEDHIRFQVDATYKHKINAFSLKYRLRYQNKNELGLDNFEENYANQHIRFKTSIRFNIKKCRLKPKFTAEIGNRIGKGEKNEFSKYRLTIGTEYNFKKLGKLNLFYGKEKELNKRIPESLDIIGLKFKYIIKNK
jgi:hypothetical protein